MHTRTTLILDNNLIRDAAQATGIQEKTKLVHMGLQSLIREAAAKRLARLYGVAKKARVPSRRAVPWS